MRTAEGELFKLLQNSRYSGEKKLNEAVINEMPICHTPSGGSYDVEVELFQHDGDQGKMIDKLNKIYRREKLTDKYGGVVHLKTPEEIQKFRKELASHPMLGMLAKKHYHVSWEDVDAAAAKKAHIGSDSKIVTSCPYCGQPKCGTFRHEGAPLICGNHHQWGSRCGHEGCKDGPIPGFNAAVSGQS